MISPSSLKVHLIVINKSENSFISNIEDYGLLFDFLESSRQSE